MNKMAENKVSLIKSQHFEQNSNSRPFTHTNTKRNKGIVEKMHIMNNIERSQNSPFGYNNIFLQETKMRDLMKQRPGFDQRSSLNS